MLMKGDATRAAARCTGSWVGSGWPGRMKVRQTARTHHFQPLALGEGNTLSLGAGQGLEGSAACDGLAKTMGQLDVDRVLSTVTGTVLICIPSAPLPACNSRVTRQSWVEISVTCSDSSDPT